MEKHTFLKNNYTAGNIFNLLLKLYSEKDFQYWDLSHIAIWGVDFREDILTGVDFTESDLKNCIFTQPLGCIHSIAFNADGNYFATGDAHGLIRVHNTETLDLCFEKGAGNQIWSVAFSLGTNSQRFALAAEDGSVKLFEIENLASGKLNFKETNSWRETGRVLSVAFSLDPESNIMAFGGDGNEITVYRIKENSTSRLPISNVSCMTFIDGSRLYSCNQEGDFIGWDLSTDDHKILYRERKRHEKLIRCIAFNATKQIIATGSEDGKLKIFNLKTETDLQFNLFQKSGKDYDYYDYTESISEIRTLAFSCDGSILAIGCIGKNQHDQSEHKILLFDLTGDQWKLISTLDNSLSENQDDNGHTHLIRSIAFSPNTGEPRCLISGGDGRTVKLWDWNKDKKKWKCQNNLRGYANRVWSVAFFPNKLPENNLPQEQQTIGNNEPIFACGCEDNKIYIWNYNDRTHIPIQTLSQHTDWVWSVAFNYDGTLLSSASEDGTIGLWKLNQSNTSNNSENPENPENPEKSKGSYWQYITSLKHSQEYKKRIRCVAFHPTENILASAGNDNTVVLWNLKNLNLRILSVACHPTKSIVASAGHDCIITLWEIKKSQQEDEYELKQINRLKGHKRAVESVVFTTDGKRLISCSQDQTIKFWDLDLDIENNMSKINISVHTIELGKPYQGMNISGVKNLDPAQISALEELGASMD